MNNSHDKLAKFYANNIISHTSNNKQETGVSDTEETVHYLKSDVTHSPSTNMGPTIHVVCQNGQTIQSSKPCLLYFSELPDKSFDGHILTSLKHSSLVSIG